MLHYRRPRQSGRRSMQRHRHNVGFVAVDAIHRRHGFSPWRRRFSGEVAEGTLSGEKVLLLKPQTYMNESGRSVQEAARFYKVEPKDIFVIHDEVDLPPGKTRMKVGGGAAGHNGLRSTRRRRSATATGASASASAIPASRRPCPTTSCTISRRATPSGWCR